jgi:tryptophan-rich sensory protein
MDTRLDGLRRRISPAEDGSFNTGTAATLAIGAVGLAGVLAVLLPSVQNSAGRFAWYRALDKPRATPPDLVFGLAWPVIESAMAYAGWRLLRQPASRRRNAALALLGVNIALIPGYNALFLRRAASPAA